ncbi:MAG: lipoyl(octanoyl) transferase LipB [Anaerolineales bacterium]|nr:lipoyl(octanoyl) transferase LipB [Anaerolineales bacterium]
MDGLWLDLGLVRYAPAFALQERALAARLAGRLPPLIVVQENPPTLTLGRDSSPDNILVSAAELAARGIELVEVNRGGDVTYHGPGQLIASPLLYLNDLGINANQYLHRLEDVLLEVLAWFGLQAERRAGYPGAWLGQAKVGAVGIGVRHGCTFHGLALNVDLDLAPFRLINPCGMAALPVTSVAAAGQRSVTMQSARLALRRALASAFDLRLADCHLADLSG